MRSILMMTAVAAAAILIQADIAAAGAKKGWSRSGKAAIVTTKRGGTRVMGSRTRVGGYSYLYNDTLDFDNAPEIDHTPPTGQHRLFDSRTSVDSMWWDQ